MRRVDLDVAQRRADVEQVTVARLRLPPRARGQDRVTQIVQHHLRQRAVVHVRMLGDEALQPMQPVEVEAARRRGVGQHCCLAERGEPDVLDDA
jgi:hypothetical protein